MKRILSAVSMLIMAFMVHAQMMEPVKFTSTLKTNNTAEGEIIFNGTIDNGWHVYSTNLGNDGPIEATFHVNKLEGAELVGPLTPRGKEISEYDNMFGMKLRNVQFVQKVKFTKPQYNIDAYLEYGACNDEMCMPPTEVSIVKSGKSPAVAADNSKEKDAEKKAEEEAAKEETEKATEAEEAGNTTAEADSVLTSQADSTVSAASSDSDLWASSVAELRALGNEDNMANRSWLYLLMMGFVGGLLAVAMPCIWPIIPMTVSFFLKRAKDDKQKGIRDAITYGLSIIVIYLTLGLLVTGLFGSDTLNAMSTNAYFNIFLFLLLVVFALSFFGWFEIKLPDKWANAVDSKATNTSGLLSIFLMAFTLVLVSFSCTAPIIGLLLVETTTSGNWIAPAVGMLGFALALALPFTLFALFPSWLKQAPKSGSWMNTLKVVLGFIELAFALKFFSVADLAYGWHLLDREVFLSLWIVIFHWQAEIPKR